MRMLLVAAVSAIGISIASTANVSALPVNASAVEDAVNENSLVTTARYYRYYHRHYRPYYRPYWHRHYYYRPHWHCWWGPYGRRCRWW